MKLKEWLKKFQFEKLRIKAGALELELSWKDQDKDAAWELYVELLTRIATQPISDDQGVEKTALESIYSLFSVVRSILKTKGRTTLEFTKIAIVILNQIIRPFTSKWHKKSEDGEFSNRDTCMEFRKELRSLQNDLIKWTKMLADIADVEDLTDFDLTYI